MEELQYLIDNHFQSLKTEKILFQFHNEKDNFAYTAKPKEYIIAFSKKDYKKMTQSQIRGVLSHELAHIVYEKSQNIVLRFIKKVLYFSSTKHQTIEERKVDMIVIEKGCGEYLLEFMKYHDKHYKKYNKTDGLTKKEIKNILENRR